MAAAWSRIWSAIHARRHFIEDFAGKDAIAFQLAQMLRQHFAGDAGNESLQFKKTAHAALTKMPEDQRVSICRR